MRLPVTPGHEFSGRVKALGEGSKAHHRVDLGDLVVSEQIVACGLCRFCKSGNYQVCPCHTVYGFQRETNGAMAEYMIFPEKARVHKIPEGVPPHHATFVEPLGSIYYSKSLIYAAFVLENNLLPLKNGKF